MTDRVAESTPGRRRALLALAAAKRRNKARVKRGEQPVIAGKRVKITTYVRKYGKPKTAEAFPFGPVAVDFDSVDILDREDVETAVGLVVELDSDPDDLRGYVAERARDLGCADLVPTEWGVRTTQPVLIQRQAEAFEAPVTISESLPGLAHGYDETGYSIGHLNTAYRLTCSEASLRHELHGIADRLEEAMEVVDNASVIATYQSNLEKRIRAGIVAKAALTNDGEAPDPDAVELAYQRHFARAVPAAVQRAAAVLGKYPVPEDDLSLVDDDDEEGDDEDSPVAEAEQAAGKSENAPKYIFGRLNKAWKPKTKAGADRFEKRTALMQKMHDLWKSGAKRGDKEWDSTVAALRGTETLRERRARYLERMDSLKARMAAGKTQNSRGEDLAAIKARLRLRLKRVQKTMKAKGIAYQSASKKSAAKPATAAPAKPKKEIIYVSKSRAAEVKRQALAQERAAREQAAAAAAKKGPKSGRKPSKGAPVRRKKRPPKLVSEAQEFLRVAEARLQEHPGDHDQRVHSPTGRAAIAKEKGTVTGAHGGQVDASTAHDYRVAGGAQSGHYVNGKRLDAKQERTYAKKGYKAFEEKRSLIDRLKAKFAKAGGGQGMRRELASMFDAMASTRHARETDSEYKRRMSLRATDRAAQSARDYEKAGRDFKAKYGPGGTG